MHISVIGLGIHGFLHELVRIEHAVNRVFIHVSDIFVGDAIFICFVKYITNRVNRNVSCPGNDISSHSIAPKLQYELHIDFFGHNIRPPSRIGDNLSKHDSTGDTCESLSTDHKFLIGSIRVTGGSILNTGYKLDPLT